MDHAQHESPPRPRLSVVVPTHNRPRLLARALDSLRSQTVPVEVIVVNDGGLQVRPVVTAAREAGLDVRLVEHDINRGRSQAMNTGLMQVRGEFACVIADDDLYYPHHAQTVLDALERLGPGHAVYTQAIRVHEDDDGTVLGREVAGDQDHDDDRIQITNVVCAMCMAMPSAVVQELGGHDTSFDVHEDWELWIRLSQRVRIVHVPVPTAEYRMRVGRSNSTTREYFRLHDALERVYAKHPLPAGSRLQAQRDRMLAASERDREAFGFDVSVAIACSGVPEDVLPTLSDVARTFDGASYEVLMLVPSVDEWEPVIEKLSGHVQTYAVGDVTAEQAWHFARTRAGGRLTMQLRAGELVDPQLTGAALKGSPGSCATIGCWPHELSREERQALARSGR
jgi:glycosyltransferase involved in cell wall biosynthesis